MKLTTCVVVAAVSCCAPFIAGCNGKSDSKASSDLTMVETDLAPRGEKWTGLSVAAPKGAKVWDDLGDCRVVTEGGKGARDFDLILTQNAAKNTIAARKASLEKLAGDVKGKVTFDAETADSFEYTMETPNPSAGKMHVRKSWFISIEAGTRTIGCEPSTSADHAAYAMLKTACKTLSAK